MRYVWLAVLVAGACGDNRATPADATPTSDAAALDGRAADAPPDVAPDANPLEPETLMGTGLCVDPACTQISPDVVAYTPRFPLWADTASKRRWMYLPPGTQIDTSDMDHWRFPVGTKFWKEFSRDDADGTSVRVETRYITKIGPGDTYADWFYVAYQWNATNDGTMAVPHGVMNANGTAHDIPPQYECRQCHANLEPTWILGFGAIQLDETSPAPGELDLDGLVAAGLLTTNPPGASSPHYPLPGNAAEQAALGYLHANCGHCHNPTSDVFLNNGITMDLRETVGALGSLAATPVYASAVGQPAMQLVGALAADCTTGTTAVPCLVDPGKPDDSALVFRFESPNPAIHMPAIATEMTDPAGDAILRAWVSQISP